MTVVLYTHQQLMYTHEFKSTNVHTKTWQLCLGVVVDQLVCCEMWSVLIDCYELYV